MGVFGGSLRRIRRITVLVAFANYLHLHTHRKLQCIQSKAQSIRTEVVTVAVAEQD